MNFSHILSEILRGQWAIEPQTALSHSSLVASLISGKSENFQPRSEFLHLVSAGSGIVTSDNYKDAPAGSVAIIPVKGTMMKYGTMCSYGTEEIAARFADAFASKKIAAIVMDIDSGGGAVNAIAPLANLLSSKSKPVIALCDTAASAAYYVASGTDHIMADNNLSAGFGSIGVVTSFVDMQPYWEMQGVKFHTIYAKESKDKNLAFEKALKGDYEMMQDEILSPLARQFQNHVKQSRATKLKSETPGILTGKMFFAEDALENGLIDSIGNMEKALLLADVKKFMNS
jgi:protease-4